jgi:4-hydroxybutyrate CoA-transferase
MATDAMVDLSDRGLLSTALHPEPPIFTPELLGTERLMEFAHENPAFGVLPSSVTHDPIRLGQIDRFVSIVSALEIDLSGQVNSEVLRGQVIAGMGGSVDYLESAARSAGGVRIVAFPSSSPDGSISRIVAQLGEQAPVTIPRTLVDTVVTEYGVARLDGKSIHERADALIAIAHPDHRDALADSVGVKR